MGATVRHVDGDILKQTTGFIVHQTNCMSSGKSAGLAADIFERYPNANTYTSTPREPGSISIHPNGNVSIVNLNAQIFWGKPTTVADRCYRKTLFTLCLCALADVCKQDGVQLVSFPYGIGCGLAGGLWPEYLEMIVAFAKLLPEGTVVQIVKYTAP